MKKAAMLAVLGLLAMAGAARAEEGGVMGTGSATITRDPDAVRLEVELRAEAKTLKEALAALKERRDAIKPELVKLGAEERSIDIAAARPIDAANDQRARILAQLRGRRSRPGPATQPAMVAVSATVKADFALPKGDADARMIAGAELVEKIRASKFFDAKAKEKTEEEEELEGMMSGESGAAPGTPSFVYVARITEADIAKATREAFEKAVKDARRLADAGSMTVGPPRTVAASSSGGAMMSDEEMMLAAYQRRYGPPTVLRGEDSEMLSAGNAPISREVSVRVICPIVAKP